MSPQPDYDALLLVSFGGPEGTDEVLPFLENVTRGRNIPRERLLAVAHHYEDFGGVSPINGQNRVLIESLRQAFAAAGIDLPIYWGNRNWHPLLPDTLRRMADDGIQRALSFVTSAYSSYSGCRQYRENIQKARAEVGPKSPRVDKLRVFFNHPGFVQANAQRLRQALQGVPADLRGRTRVFFSAHSIPRSMADGCPYQAQLEEACRLVTEDVGWADWGLVFQSRSGPPSQPWLEPDVCDVIRGLEGSGCGCVVISPIGFLSDHMEVVYDLDAEAAQECDRLGMKLIRAATAGTHPAFVDMVRELVQERLSDSVPKRSLGPWGLFPEQCSADCCLYPRAGA